MTEPPYELLLKGSLETFRTGFVGGLIARSLIVVLGEDVERIGWSDGAVRSEFLSSRQEFLSSERPWGQTSIMWRNPFSRDSLRSGFLGACRPPSTMSGDVTLRCLCHRKRLENDRGCWWCRGQLFLNNFLKNDDWIPSGCSWNGSILWSASYTHSTGFFGFRGDPYRLSWWADCLKLDRSCSWPRSRHVP